MKEKRRVLIAQNEFVKDWIMHAYTYKSPSIYNIAKQLKNCSKETIICFLLQFCGICCSNKVIQRELVISKEAESCASVEILLFKRGKPLMSLEGRINDGWIYWPATIIFWGEML